MKGPKGILAESIATALADFFVVDQAAVETNLLRDAGIFLRNTKLKPQTIHLSSSSPYVTAHVEGVVQDVAFQWHWGKDSDEKGGGSDWVKDVKLTISGLNFTAVLSQSESSTDATPLKGKPAGKEPPATTPVKPESKGSIMSYVQDQVQGIMDTLELDVRDFEFRLQLPSGTSMIFGGSGLVLKSLGNIKGDPLKQRLALSSLYSSVLQADGSKYPLMEPISYKAECVRTFGKRFLGGIEKGLKVLGESFDNGVIVHAGLEQLRFVNELLGLLLSVKTSGVSEGNSKEDKRKSNPIEKITETRPSDDHSSYFELPLSALSLVFPNDTKISLSGLVAKYQMDGSTLQIEGREGISVNGFPVVKLGDMSLWRLDMVTSEFNMLNPQDNQNCSDVIVASIQMRDDELQSVTSGLDQILAIVKGFKDGASSVLMASIDDTAHATKAPNRIKGPPNTSSSWTFKLQGRLEFQWSDAEHEIGVEFSVLDVVAISEPLSLEIKAIDQLRIPGKFKLSKPIENTRMTFDGSMFDINIGDFVATLEDEMYPSPSVDQAPSTEESAVLVNGETLSSSLTKSEHITELHKSTKTATPFVLPFSVVAAISMVTIYKPDGKTTHIVLNDTHVALGPNSPLPREGQTAGGIRIALLIESVVLDMIRLNAPSFSAVVHPEDLGTIFQFVFQANKVAIAAGYTAMDWQQLLKVGDPIMKPNKQRGRKKEREESSKPLQLPFARVEPLKVKILVSSDLVGFKESTLHFDAFKGIKDTTVSDLIGFYSSRVLARAPNVIVNAEVFGTGVADTLAGTYGSTTGAVALSSLGVAAGPVGGILGIAAFDGVRNVIKAGKASRGADDDDKFQLFDFARGLQYTAVEATREGAARRGKGDDQRGDPLDWAVGATSDVASYTVENKARLGAAGAGAIGFMYGLALGGPVGAVLGTVVATVATSKAIHTAEYVTKEIETDPDNGTSPSKQDG